MRPRGFIALTSVIILSALLLSIVGAVSLGGFYARSTLLDEEYKEESRALAQACVQHVLAALRADATYAGGSTVDVGSESCTVEPGASGSPRTFHIRAVYKREYTNLAVGIDIPTLITKSLVEVPKF